MLVLSRKKEEKIVFKVPGRKNEIVISVVRVDNNNRVRLGISADDDIVILRSELSETSGQ